jgi:ArsR family transcriptional regulator
MELDYETNAQILKVLSDAKRLKIIDMLSCGEKCACELLDYFNFTQPTLSYHMKLLIECGLVNGRKVAQWNHYSLNRNKFNQVMLFLMTITTETDGCICYSGNMPGADDERNLPEKQRKCCG